MFGVEPLDRINDSPPQSIPGDSQSGIKMKVERAPGDRCLMESTQTPGQNANEPLRI